MKEGSPISNPLIEQRKDDKTFSGAGLLDSIEDVASPFLEGKTIDPLALGIDGVALGLDLVGFLTDPLGSHASSVVGWIIDNVGFVRKPFDDLMGDPPSIEAAAKTWQNIAKRLHDTKQSHQDALKNLDGSSGEASMKYQERAKAILGGLTQSAAAAESAANKIQIAGALVSATRALIRDLLADLAGTLLLWGIPAAAAAIPTAGASIAAFITRAVTKAVQIGTKIARFLSKLFKALDKLGSLAKSAAQAMRKSADDLAALGRQMPNSRYGNQRAAELAADSATRASRADSLDSLGNAGRSARDAVDNAMNKVDDIAQRTSQKVDDWAARVKENGPARQQKVKDLFERMNQPPLNTRKENMPDPQVGVSRAADRVDAPLSKGLLDGQNWVRAAASRDLSHVAPNWGDLIHPAKEFSKELNKAFGGGHQDKEGGK